MHHTLTVASMTEGTAEAADISHKKVNLCVEVIQAGGQRQSEV